MDYKINNKLTNKILFFEILSSFMQPLTPSVQMHPKRFNNESFINILPKVT